MAVFLPFAQPVNNMYTHEDIIASNKGCMSALCEVDGFHFSRFLQDALHGLNMGPAAHNLGGVLNRLADIGRTRQTALLSLWNRFDEGCKEHRIPNGVPSFASGMISMATKKSSSPKTLEWKCKAFNCRLVTSWLAFYIQNLVHLPDMMMFNTALSSVSRLCSAMENDGRFLNKDDANVMRQDGLS